MRFVHGSLHEGKESDLRSLEGRKSEGDKLPRNSPSGVVLTCGKIRSKRLSLRNDLLSDLPELQAENQQRVTFSEAVR